MCANLFPRQKELVEMISTLRAKASLLANLFPLQKLSPKFKLQSMLVKIFRCSCFPEFRICSGTGEKSQWNVLLLAWHLFLIASGCR